MLKAPGKFIIALFCLFFASRAAAGENINAFLIDTNNPSGTEKQQDRARGTDGQERRCAAISVMAASKDKNISSGLASALLDPDPVLQACALRAAAETKNTSAVVPLMANVSAYLSAAGRKGPYEDNIRARLKAINSIWALGEIGSPEVTNGLKKFYQGSDDIIKMNLLISLGKLGPGPGSAGYIREVAASGEETEVVRAVAFEMLEEMGQKASLAGLVPSRSSGMEKGDLLYTGGMIGSIGSWENSDLPVGHAGIFEGTEIKDGRIYVLIGDCVPNNFVPPGVRNINSWKNFTHHYKFPFYGNRTSEVRPSAAQRKRIVQLALELGAKGLKYSVLHTSQKGPVEFDCVGYTEYIYEQAGLNPTDNKLETGWGWPLTPWEQFEGTVPNAPALTPQLVSAPADTQRAPGQAAQELQKMAGITVETNVRIIPQRVY
ncbi:MAG: hypothetical protein COT18_01010 [Elusimicrobia bacterium CG08_land_8_20_14_0_20_59_10]|nr:MAG: hypothetical protein COT18_01010 [Elusimicrobia bacterium CG08_land_8_20_14_0_20_59_10]